MHLGRGKALAIAELRRFTAFRVASPCIAEWSDMKGDDLARLCLKCDKNVYNLSLMTLDEANELIREKEGNLCISLYKRFDGTVLTADCPVGLRTIRRSYLKTRAKAIALALTFWGFISGTNSSCNMTSQTLGIPALPPDFTADLNSNKSLEWWSVNGTNDTTLNEIRIGATGQDSSSLWIFIDSAEHAPGTFINHHGVLPAGGYRNNSQSDSNIWFTGELHITDFSTSHTSGTFHFNATRTTPGGDTVMITNGSFNVPIFIGKIR